MLGVIQVRMAKMSDKTSKSSDIVKFFITIGKDKLTVMRDQSGNTGV